MHIENKKFKHVQFEHLHHPIRFLQLEPAFKRIQLFPIAIHIDPAAVFRPAQPRFLEATGDPAGAAGGFRG